MRRSLAAAWLVLALAFASEGAEGEQQGSATLQLDRAIPLGRVRGRIDHLAADVERGRIFVAELGNGSVDVVDLSTGRSRRIEGLKEPQGVAYVQNLDEIVVATGGDGTVRFFNATSLQPQASLRLGEDADNVRVDPKTHEIMVGFGSGALAIIDPARRSLLRTIALPAHPEGFQISAADGRVFVNLPDAKKIAVVDVQGARVLQTWAGSRLYNFPMAISQDGELLGVVYRRPPRLALLDAASGALRQELPTCGDADDLFFDNKRHRIYVSCGSGRVDVFARGDAGFVASGHVETRSGARTSLFIPELDALVVAAPHAWIGSDAELLVYHPIP